MDEDDFDPSKPLPIEAPGLIVLEDDDLEWVEAVGLNSLSQRMSEGAVFTRIGENAFIIAVKGAQILHDDRHLDYMEDTKGFSQDTWNIVASPSSGQMLLCEVGHKDYEHFKLDATTLIYFNTYNRHALTRKSPNDTVVLLQVDGFGPDQMHEAIAAMRDVVTKRQILGLN